MLISQLMGYFTSMLEWNHIPNDYYIALMVVLVISYIIIFHVFNTYFPTVQTSCFKKCKSDFCKHNVKPLRGSNYFLSNVVDPSYCLITFWEGTHFIFHMFLGFFYNLYVSLAIGVGFEIIEVFTCDCASALDIWWNLFGYLIGHTARYFIYG